MPTTLVTDLWPTDLFGAPSTPTPVAVLRQQGEALGARTHNFVLGEVDTESNPQGTVFTHKLMLVAPFLRYRKPMLYVHHDLQPFPAEVYEGELTRPQNQEQWRQTVSNEQELQDRLREFFNEPRVKEVLRTVFNLSNDVAPVENAGM